MIRYAATFALLGFLATVVLSMFSDAPIPSVLEAAITWAIVCALVGVAISLVTRRIVDELELPTVEDEIEAEKHEQALREYRQRMDELAKQFPMGLRSSMENAETSQEAGSTTDNAGEGNSALSESPAVG